MRYPVLFTAVMCLATNLPEAAPACSTFFLPNGGRPLLGRNFDWHIGNGLLLVNRKDFTKTAISYGKPAQWTSRHGSITFNQYRYHGLCGRAMIQLPAHVPCHLTFAVSLDYMQS